ncbi:MAG: hypothetical protein ABW252_12770 [Polyangiales bacterium]
MLPPVDVPIGQAVQLAVPVITSEYVLTGHGVHGPPVFKGFCCPYGHCTHAVCIALLDSPGVVHAVQAITLGVAGLMKPSAHGRQARFVLGVGAVD